MMWKRLGVVASVLWIAVYTLIASQSHIRIMDRSGDADSGFWLLLAGFVIVWTVCLGVPWVRKAQ